MSEQSPIDRPRHEGNNKEKESHEAIPASQWLEEETSYSFKKADELPGDKEYWTDRAMFFDQIGRFLIVDPVIDDDLQEEITSSLIDPLLVDESQTDIHRVEVAMLIANYLHGVAAAEKSE